jgi:hypothetical protein
MLSKQAPRVGEGTSGSSSLKDRVASNVNSAIVVLLGKYFEDGCVVRDRACIEPDGQDRSVFFCDLYWCVSGVRTVVLNL